MRAGLFIPCYVDAFHPEVGIATLELLERLGVDVHYPVDQACCGQPMANNGDQESAAAAESVLAGAFEGCDVVVGPSASCVKQIRDHLDAIEQTEEVKRVRRITYELVEFLHDILKVESLPWAEFPHRVGLHNSCAMVRGLGLAKPSEVAGPAFNKAEALLAKVKGLTLVPLDRVDECCGFGGTFSITSAAVSARMGRARVEDHVRHGAEYVTSCDVSCLMHLRGIAGRARAGVKFIHVAQILNGGPV